MLEVEMSSRRIRWTFGILLRTLDALCLCLVDVYRLHADECSFAINIAPGCHLSSKAL
jgi:hypothetical protein